LNQHRNEYQKRNTMKKLTLHSLCTVAAIALTLSASRAAAQDTKPLRALLIAGGCCHDYKNQKDILKNGLEARANLVVDVIFSPDGSTRPKMEIYGKPDYAAGYDVILHDECAADISDAAVIEGVLKPHRDGIPGVNLHCAMHSYRIGNPNEAATAGTPRAMWFDYLGIQSSGHGAQLPIVITQTAKEHPINRGLSDWITINEELYNNVQVRDAAQSLARGKQVVKQKKKQADGTETVTEKPVEYVVTWVNSYQDKTRVFSTTIGHNNATVADPRYLDLVTRGLLWSCGKLDDQGKPLPGYGPKK
jgi:hypothetical protein